MPISTFLDVKPTEAFLAYPSVRFMSSIVRAFSEFAVTELLQIDGIVNERHLSIVPTAEQLDSQLKSTAA